MPPFPLSAVLFVTVTWEIEDENPSELRMYVDDDLNETISWTNQTTYIFNATGLDIGIYELKLVASDLNSNSNESIVSLRIFENVTPVVDSPDDLEFFYTETGQSLRWNLTDDYLDSYILYRDDEGIENGTLDPDEPFYSTSITGLSVGVYNYALWVNDTSGNSAFGNVTVTVNTDNIAPVFTYEPGDVFYARGDSNIIRNWTVTDDYKATYSIAVDGLEVVQAEYHCVRPEQIGHEHPHLRLYRRREPGRKSPLAAYNQKASTVRCRKFPRNYRPFFRHLPRRCRYEQFFCFPNRPERVVQAGYTRPKGSICFFLHLKSVLRLQKSSPVCLASPCR